MSDDIRTKVDAAWGFKQKGVPREGPARILGAEVPPPNHRSSCCFAGLVLAGPDVASKWLCRLCGSPCNEVNV